MSSVLALAVFLALARLGFAASPLPAPKAHRPPAYDAHTVLVRFRAGTGRATRAAAVEDGGGRLGASIRGTDFTLVRVERGTAQQLLGRLREDPRVAEAVPNFIRRAQEDPNDASFWVREQPFETIRLPQAWNTTHGSSAIKIAIVDTGVDLDQPDLAPRILPGKDFVNGDDVADDDAGHGTMVAGIAAGTPNNGFGVAGAAWNASIVPVKVLNASGRGTDADVAAGITWAADAGSTVINLSLGGPADSPVLQQAVDYALSKDALVVAAAGNAASSAPSYPAAYTGVVAVASTDDAGESSYFSNHGTWVDLAAPGESIYSTAPVGQGLDGYTYGSGTSFASPLVAGVAALVRAANPAWTQAQVASRLYSTARDMGPPGLDDSYGWGLVDAAAALGSPRQPALRPSRDALEPNGTPDEAKPIGSGASATISPENDVDWFYVDASAGTWLTITVTPPDETFDPVLEAYTPDLHLLQREDRGGPDGTEQIVLPVNEAGRYYLRVSNYSGSRTTSAMSSRGDFITPNYTVSVSQASAPSSRFAPAELYTAGLLNADGRMTTWPQWTDIGDLTGDGRPDVVLSTNSYGDPVNDNKVFVFPQLADGSLGTATRIDPGCRGPVGDLGDMNGDGKVDLVVGCGDAGMKIFFQDGGVLSAPLTLADPKASSFQIVDINGDGRNDVLAPTLAGVSLAINTGAGFATSVVTPLRLRPRAGDVTGDGRPDIVALGDGATVYVYAQRPDGSFADAVTYAAPNNGVWSGSGIAVGDLTGDGRADVAVSIGANYPNSLVDVLPQTAGGTLGPAVSYTVYDIPGALVVADVDRDGRNDLVMMHDGWSAAGLMLQNAGGTLQPEELYGVGYASSYPDVAVGDVNGDGDPDLAVPNYNYGLVVLHQYSRNLPPREQLWIGGTSPSDFAGGVATTATPTIRFVRALDAASLSSSTVGLRNGDTGAAVAASPAYDAGTRTLTIRPTAALSATTPYVLTVAGVKDAAGNVMSEPFSIRFTTASTADVYPPETMIWNGSEGTMASSSLGFSFVSEDRAAAFTCSLNGSAFTACSSPVVYSVSPGTYTFQVRARDAAGNVDPTPARKRVVIIAVGQSTPETWLASQWPYGDVADTTATFTLGSDRDGGFECSLDGAAYSACTSTVTYSGLAPGVHTFSARALYNAVVDPTPLAVAWTVVSDTTPPETTLDSGPAGTVASSLASFTFSSSEPGSRFECSLDGGAFTACTSPATYSGLADGEHTFRVHAIDTAGNVDTTPAARTWTVDTTPPETSIDSGPADPSASGAASFAFSSSEAGSIFECSLDAAAFAACSSPATFSGLTDGSHTFRVRAIDAAGNVDPKPASYGWLIQLGDRTPPTVALISPASGAVVRGWITLAAEATDDVTVDHVAFTVNGFAVGSDSTAPFQLDWATSAVADGVTAVGATAFDDAGNEATASVSVTVDNTAPQTELLGGPPSLTSSRAASFGFSAGEPARFECSLDGSAFAPCSSPVTYDGLGDGAHGFSVRAVDVAGNVDQTPAVGSWTVDATPPETTIVSGPSGTVADGRATFGFGTVGPATFECSLDGTTFAACSSPVEYANLPAGEHLFLVRAIDLAGNADPTPASRGWTVQFGGALSAPPPVHCTVPHLKSKTIATARRLLARAHCRLSRVRTAYSRRVGRGRIFAQTPRPGTRLPNRGRVGVVVSRGRLR